MWQSVSIRMSLLRNLVGMIILLAGGILVTTIFAARTAVTSLSESVMNVSIELTKNRLREFFEPVTQELLVARQWGESGVLSLDDPDSMMQLLEPVLEQYPQISSVILANEDGREYMLMRTADGFAGREVNVQEWGTRTRWLHWSDAAPEPVETWQELDYDPRRRPWFEGAMTRNSAVMAESSEADAREFVRWTPPYVFFTSKQPGITAAVVYDPPAGPRSVIAVDIHLASISRYTESLEVTEHGGVIVLTQDTRVIGLPRNAQVASREARAEALLRQPEEIGLQLASDASASFRANIGNLQRPPVQFESEGENWWGKGDLFELGPDRRFWVGVVIPERDMIDNMALLRVWIVGITLTVILVAVVRALLVARWFSSPIEQLVRQSDMISRGDLEDHEPVASKVVEVQALAEAQSHMRTALRSLLKMERDMQLAKQIQQESFPETLPAIDGYAIGAWADPADETGGDIYDVIGINLRDDVSGDPSERVVLANDNPRYAVFVLADATGHGIGPALAVSQFRAMVRMAIRTGRKLDSFGRHVNDQLCQDLPSGRFITAWIGLLDAEKNELVSFSAGHAPLLHYIAARGECDVMDADIMPFGITPNLTIPPRLPISLGKGDFFIVCSDGIVEMKSANGELFGRTRLVEFIRQHRDLAPDAWLDALRSTLEAFAGGEMAHDDITALVLKRL